MAAWAAASLACHVASHAGSTVSRVGRLERGVDPASPPTWWNSLTTAVGSVHCHHGSTQTTRARPPPRRRRSRRAPWRARVHPAGPRSPATGRPGAHDGVGGGDGPRQAAARAGIGQDRPAEALAQQEQLAGSLVASAPATIMPRPQGASSDAVSAGAGRASGPGARAAGRRADEWFAKGQVEMDRPRAERPVRASATARAASGRHDAACDSSGTPGSQDQRVEVVNSPTWSMVCDAPT